MDDPRYNKYIQWHNSSFPIKRTPKLFKLISAKASKMFRKFLEPKIERRIKSLNELHKYLDERWLARSAEKEMAGKARKLLFLLLPMIIDFLSNPIYFFFQSTNQTNLIHRFIPSTVISMKKINCYIHSLSKALRLLWIELQRKIA